MCVGERSPRPAAELRPRGTRLRAGKDAGIDNLSVDPDTALLRMQERFRLEVVV